jgi:hypothetical protein
VLAAVVEAVGDRVGEGMFECAGGVDERLAQWGMGGGEQQCVAARHQATPAQVVFAWLLATSPVALAIPGSSSPGHLTENVAAAGLRLKWAAWPNSPNNTRRVMRRRLTVPA